MGQVNGEAGKGYRLSCFKTCARAGAEDNDRWLACAQHNAQHACADNGVDAHVESLP